VSLILDTSVLLAALNAADPDHALCAALVQAAAVRERLLVPSTVLVELAYWVRGRLGAQAWHAFTLDLLAGAYSLEAVTLEDIRRADQVDQQYAALELGLVDASIVAIAERLGDQRIATLNYRDFRSIVPSHVPHFQLLPADGY
jgi:uncharacterized protein